MMQEYDIISGKEFYMFIQTQTRRLYDDDAYAADFEAVVLSAAAGARNTLEVVLDQTLFFPEEGGQTPDRGTLAGFPVKDVRIRDGIITHYLQVRESDPLPEAGQTVHGRIDFAHRFSNMQNHTGEHILSGLLHNLYGYENIGFRLSDHTVTLDTGGLLDDEALAGLERRANEVVWSNVPVVCAYPSPDELAALSYRSKKEIDGPVRIVTIEGIDRCACCAPHVARTGEIGLIRILDAVREGQHMRLTIICGSRALEDLQVKTRQLAQISRLTSLPQERASEGVERLLQENIRLREQCRQQERSYVDRLVQQYAAAAGDASGKDAIVFENSLSAAAQRELMNQLLEYPFRFAGVFVGNDKDGWHYCIGSRRHDARLPGKMLREELNARGGGSSLMVQGSVGAPRAGLENHLSRFLNELQDDIIH